MNYQNLLVEKKKGVALVTLNRPEFRNALDSQTWSEIKDFFQSNQFDQELIVVVITGAGGKAFASGADIKMLQSRTALETLRGETHAVLSLVENFNKPVIAAIDGFALGGGCELAMACDIRIATPKSKLGQPEVGLGLIPGGGGTQRLQKLVGLAKAKELIFTGEIITAEQALQIGLVNKVVESSDALIPETMLMANKIAEKGPLAVSLAKMAINGGSHFGLPSGLLLEKLAQTVAFSSEDRIEGTSAFLEKRKAQFKGK
jgi:enoyl-CoA hydratase